GAMTLKLIPNKDIAASLGAIKQPHQILAGFALETNDETVHAVEKLKHKKFDFIVLNSLRDKGAGFRCDTNKVTLIDTKGEVKAYPLKEKRDVAKDIMNKLATLLK
ncbi:MAG: phosphopantothenoylcysteine decarboxylase, partial [Parabacteroides sp.]|nr:phosphopantothenoylcysteine decarboxylase [Parabacteroides sp.]